MCGDLTTSNCDVVKCFVKESALKPQSTVDLMNVDGDDAWNLNTYNKADVGVVASGILDKLLRQKYISDRGWHFFWKPGSFNLPSSQRCVKVLHVGISWWGIWCPSTQGSWNQSQLKQRPCSKRLFSIFCWMATSSTAVLTMFVGSFENSLIPLSVKMVQRLEHFQKAYWD